MIYGSMKQRTDEMTCRIWLKVERLLRINRWVIVNKEIPLSCIARLVHLGDQTNVRVVVCTYQLELECWFRPIEPRLICDR